MDPRSLWTPIRRLLQDPDDAPAAWVPAARAWRWIAVPLAVIVVVPLVFMVALAITFSGGLFGPPEFSLDVVWSILLAILGAAAIFVGLVWGPGRLYEALRAGRGRRRARVVGASLMVATMFALPLLAWGALGDLHEAWFAIVVGGGLALLVASPVAWWAGLRLVRLPRI